MKFVLLTRYTTVARDDATLKAHREWLIPQSAAGSFVLSGSFGDFEAGPAGELAALAVIEAASYYEAEEIVSAEPLFAQGCCTHELLPFTPRVRRADLEGAFAQDMIVIPPL